MKILITGGSGTLGRALIALLAKTEHKFDAPSSKLFDITKYDSIAEYSLLTKFDIVIHCAAYTDVKQAEVNFVKALETNVIGTCNIVKYCSLNNSKLVYISTDHVFDGQKGDYSTTDKVNPIAKYAKSKAAGEIAARMYDKSLVIRTSFFTEKFPYDKAFTDQWISKDYIDIIAPKVLKACLSDKTGIVHCGSPKSSVFDIAKRRKPCVEPITRADFSFPTLRDTSLVINSEFD